MKTFLLAATAAIALASAAHATTPLADSHDTTTNNIPVATAGAAAAAQAGAAAGAVSGSYSSGGDAHIGNVGGGFATNLTNVSPEIKTTISPVIQPKIDVSPDIRTTTTDFNNVSTDVNQFGIQANKQITSNGSESVSGVDHSGNSSNDNRSAASANDSSTHSAAANNANNNGGNTLNVDQNYEAADIPKPAVNTAYAAPAVIGGGVCAYTPFSAGLSFRVFSGSASGAKIDDGCERRANADTLARMGYLREATALLMHNPEVARAFSEVKNSPVVAVTQPEPRPAEQATNTVLPTMPSNPAKGTMLPIPNTKTARN